MHPVNPLWVLSESTLSGFSATSLTTHAQQLWKNSLVSISQVSLWYASNRYFTLKLKSLLLKGNSFQKCFFPGYATSWLCQYCSFPRIQQICICYEFDPSDLCRRVYQLTVFCFRRIIQFFFKSIRFAKFGSVIPFMINVTEKGSIGKLNARQCTNKQLNAPFSCVTGYGTVPAFRPRL